MYVISAIQTLLIPSTVRFWIRLEKTIRLWLLSVVLMHLRLCGKQIKPFSRMIRADFLWLMIPTSRCNCLVTYRYLYQGYSTWICTIRTSALYQQVFLWIVKVRAASSVRTLLFNTLDGDTVFFSELCFFSAWLRLLHMAFFKNLLSILTLLSSRSRSQAWASDSAFCMGTISSLTSAYCFFRYKAGRKRCCKAGTLAEQLLNSRSFKILREPAAFHQRVLSSLCGRIVLSLNTKLINVQSAVIPNSS